MCGRYVSKDQAAVERVFNVTRGGGDVFEDHFNAAPTLTLPVIRVHRERGRELAGLRWGLVPYWAKDAKMGAGMINARSETSVRKAAFRHAFLEYDDCDEDTEISHITSITEIAPS